MAATATALKAREMPRQKALMAMPESDLGWPAKNGFKAMMSLRGGRESMSSEKSSL